MKDTLIIKRIITPGTIPLAEIHLKSKEDIEELAGRFDKPIFQVVNATLKDYHHVPTSKVHSFLLIIHEGVHYKFIYDVKDEQK